MPHDEARTMSTAQAPALHAALPAANAADTLLLPSVDTPWRHLRAYAGAVMGSLLGTQPLRLHARPAYSAPVVVSAKLLRRWRALFDVPARAATAVPMLANQSVGTLVYTRIFGDLGLKLRDLMHLRHATVHLAGVAAFARPGEQQLHCRVQRVLRLADQRVVVELETRICAPDGSLLAVVEDGFVVRGLPGPELDGLRSDRALMRELVGLRRRLPRLSTTEGNALVAEMPVRAGLGLAYGRVSGDWNPVHTSRLGAWLFGLDQPFLQGLGLRHLVVRHLAELGVSVERLQITFARPAHLGQALLLAVEGRSGGAFEVHDAQGRLVAYGHCGRLAEPASQPLAA